MTRTRRLDLAEDALSEAFARASEQWPRSGTPANPAGWLYTTASRVIIGAVRSETARGHKARLLAARPDWNQTVGRSADGDLGDERLAMILLCCHPALRPESRAPLALRLVVGTPTEQIARLFLVSRPTMAARITRAKKKIVVAGIPLAAPVEQELSDRLDDVCQTIYLAFTAGYAPSAGAELTRADLAAEAVELAEVLARLVPDAVVVLALRSLLLLQHARRDARVRDGGLVTLPDQDRSLWRHGELRRGLAIVDELPATTGAAEELRLQALIAAEHAKAQRANDTDWWAIVGHYDALAALTGSPIVRLNRAVAVAEADGPRRGLAALDDLGETLAANHRFHAVRAELARRAGQRSLARTAYAAALDLCTNEVELRYLSAQAASLDAEVDERDGDDLPNR